MVSKVFTGDLFGLDTRIIEVETDFTHGLSNFNIVGLADKSVQEAKDRIVSAIRNSKVSYQPNKITVNLAPANLSKSGVIFDLSIAIGILVSSGEIEEVSDKDFFIGELALDGSLRPITGALPLIYGAKKAGFKRVFLPSGNNNEAGIIDGIETYLADSLDDLIQQLKTKNFKQPSPMPPPPEINHMYDFKYIKGQSQARKAAEIAVAGGHNILMNGIPGAGKTLIAKSIPSIMPELNFEQSLEVSKIHSIAGLLNPKDPLITTPPFRSPHHTSSQISLVGGGRNPRPGEVTLAHRGVLFLDEFPEFPSLNLEALRQPLEDRDITISRAAYSVKFPADFILIAAMNPCKCGYFGHPNKRCTCSTQQRINYTRKISGPLLDRIDIKIHVKKIDYDNFFKKQESESSSEILERILRAREIQQDRNSKGKNNSSLSASELEKNLNIRPKAYALLVEAVNNLDLSARTYFRILKVARTIADLAEVEEIDSTHISEALNLRVTS